MNIFKFKFTKTMVAFIIVALILVLAGLGVNIYRFTLISDAPTYYIVSLILTTLITLILIAVIISILFFTKYIITETKVITKFGFIKNQFLISDIKQVTHFKTKNKLIVYFSDRFTVIVIDEKFYDLFINALMENNNKIIYDIQSGGKN